MNDNKKMVVDESLTLENCVMDYNMPHWRERWWQFWLEKMPEGWTKAGHIKAIDEFLGIEWGDAPVQDRQSHD